MTAESTRQPVARPARGTRPANRRQLILDAATDLFSRKGYAGVTMGDVADAVAIGPSALYRHFHSKQDLLAAVVAEALYTLSDALTAAENEPSSDVAAALAAVVLKHRGAGVLWQREVRQLSPADRATFRAAIEQIAARFAALIRTRRPGLGAAEADLLSWSGLAVATSVSLHSLELPEPEFTTLLAELISTVIDAPIPPQISRGADLANTSDAAHAIASGNDPDRSDKTLRAQRIRGSKHRRHRRQRRHQRSQPLQPFPGQVRHSGRGDAAWGRVAPHGHAPGLRNGIRCP